MAIQRALISVSDKTGLEEFAKGLHEFGVELISTGGTAAFLKGLGLPVIEISDYTGEPELFEGRLKTLHPMVHGGLLHRRDNEEHVRQAKENGIKPIDLVCVNLYPFEETVARPGVTLEEAIEKIDIGGPSSSVPPPRITLPSRWFRIPRITRAFWMKCRPTRGIRP